ncbi:MAG TPA: transglutaminase family protein [Chlamydiales bacterium]|nr:transglutaminase family protein [Chlamydiales bacterium]
MRSFLFLLLFLLLAIHSVAANPSLNALYSTLDPTSVSQHFAFYALYPNTQEGRAALQHAWSLLSGSSTGSDSEIPLPVLNTQSILSLIHRNHYEDAPLLCGEQLTVMDQLSKHLMNRKLQGYGLWDQEAILRLPSQEIDLGRTLLIAELGPDEKQKIQSYEATLDLMALQILARLKVDATPLEKIRAINDYIFSEMRFRFPPHSLYAKEIDVYTFLPSVLDNRRGVCLGVSILYLCLAQRIDLPLQAITPPGHIYLRYIDPDGNHTNIETTARGIDVPTEHYQGVAAQTLQERSIAECVGLAFMNQAAVSWHQGDIQTAITLYEKAHPFLKDDYLLNLFLGFNYLFSGQDKKGKAMLRNIQGKSPEHVRIMDTIVEDYLEKRVDIEGIQAVFAEVDETRDSILKKQKRLEDTLVHHPRFRQGLFHLAVTWMQLGREKEALLYLATYAKSCPTDPTANYYLAAIHLQRHNFNQAWKYLRAAEKVVCQKNYTPKALVELRRSLQRQCPERNNL